MTRQATDNQQKRTGTRRQTLEQKRGRQAWDYIEFIKSESQQRKNNDTLQKEYRTRVSQLNTMIQINGLGQTLGFLKSKKEQPKEKAKKLPLPNAYDYLLYHLTHWTSGLFPLQDPGTASPDVLPERYDNLLRWIMYEATGDDYRRATTECLAFGTWLRRFAEAELKAPENAGFVTTREAASEASEQTESAANSEVIPEVPENTEAAATSQEGTV